MMDCLLVFLMAASEMDSGYVQSGFQVRLFWIYRSNS